MIYFPVKSVLSVEAMLSSLLALVRVHVQSSSVAFVLSHRTCLHVHLTQKSSSLLQTTVGLQNHVTHERYGVFLVQ